MRRIDLTAPQYIPHIFEISREETYTLIRARLESPGTDLYALSAENFHQ